MRVLIVEGDAGLATIWRSHLERNGATVTLASGQDAAIRVLQHEGIDIIVLDLDQDQGSALAVADYASYRQPRARIVPVTRRNFFSDGSIFSHMPNVCSYLATGTPPEDLAAIVEHYGAGA